MSNIATRHTAIVPTANSHARVVDAAIEVLKAALMTMDPSIKHISHDYRGSEPASDRQCRFYMTAYNWSSEMTNDIDASRRPVVSIRDGEVFADSRDVAAYFEKRHTDVLRDIRNLHCSDEFRRRNFASFKNKDLTGEFISHVEMTKDGFSFLAMGFTGMKAGAFKESYIGEFNAMEAELRKPRSITVEDLLASPAQLLAITQGYAMQIEDLRREKAELQTEADALDRISGTDDLFGVRAAAKILQMQEKKFVVWLQRIGWAYRQNGTRSLLCYADKQKVGYVLNKMTTYTKPDGTEGVRDTLRITAKGMVRLAKMLNINLTEGDLFGHQQVAA